MRVIDCEYDNEMRPISVSCEDDGEYYSFDLIPKGEWISVDEKLPEHNQRVLICYKFPYNKGVKMLDLAFFQKVGKYDEVEGKRNVFCYDSYEWGYCPYEHVTHWMPLPEPPKEVNND